MTNYRNDSPIDKYEDDLYGVAPFSKAIAKSIYNIKAPLGTTIAINGKWGSGKSSAVNLIRKELESFGDEKIIVSEFKCWWYRGEDALALAFLQDMHSILKDSLGDKIKDLIPSLAQRLLQAGPVIGAAVSLASGNPLTALFTGASSFISTFFPGGKTVERTFKSLSKILENENRRFIIIIDDIDRLSPEEAISIFRIVKSFGHLPNIIYLLVFDRFIADNAIQARYPSEDAHFLEKIVQASFEIPVPIQSDLNRNILSSLEGICGTPDQLQIQRFMNIFYDVVVPYMSSPRHVVRFQNAISVTWPAISGEVNMADFMALEVLRLYEPILFNSIRTGKSLVCGVRHQLGSDQRDERYIEEFLSGVPKGRHEVAKLAMRRLFPRLESMGYGQGFQRQWDLERRVCIERHFDTYFRLSLSDETLPIEEIKNLVAMASNREFVKATMRRAAARERQNGRSMVPVYLDELCTHAASVRKEDVVILIGVLFEIHDEIDLERDDESGAMSFANTSLRIHWLIRRLTSDRFSLAERSHLYKEALNCASIGWMVDFVSSARDDYPEGQKSPSSEEDCLVDSGLLGELTNKALNAIRSAAADMSLLAHRDLVYLLYRWRDFQNGDPAEVRRWTDKLLSKPEALVTLARRMTSRSWSIGIGGFGALGDRVSVPTTIASISDDTDILDLPAFRSALDSILVDGAINSVSVSIVKEFLDAWDKGTNRKKPMKIDEEI